MTAARIRPTRRRVLKGAIALASIAAGGVGGLVALRGCAPSVDGLKCLSDHEYRTLTALATALFPVGGAFEPGAATFDLARAFDGFLADEAEDRRGDLKKAMTLLEYGPLVYDKRVVTFSHLSAEDRLAHFERWAESDDLVRRQVAVALRRFLSVSFYDRLEVWPHIGYAIGAAIPADGGAP